MTGPAAYRYQAPSWRFPTSELTVSARIGDFDELAFVRIPDAEATEGSVDVHRHRSLAWGGVKRLRDVTGSQNVSSAAENLDPPGADRCSVLRRGYDRPDRKLNRRKDFGLIGVPKGDFPHAERR